MTNNDNGGFLLSFSFPSPALLNLNDRLYACPKTSTLQCVDKKLSFHTFFICTVCFFGMNAKLSSYAFIIPPYEDSNMSKHENYDLQEIGTRLRLLRSHQRKTQSTMAKELGISLSHYSKLEIGIGGMSHGLALALCRQFSLPEDWLLYGSGPQPDLDNIKPMPRPATPKTSTTANSGISDEQLITIMEIALQDNFKTLAEQVATTMNITLPRAMAILIREKLRAAPKNSASDNN